MSYDLTAAAVESEFKLNTLERLVLIILAHHENRKTKRCFPSVATVAKIADKSERQVRRAIASLAKQKIIRIVHRKRASSLYFFPGLIIPTEGSPTVAICNSSIPNNRSNLPPCHPCHSNKECTDYIKEELG